MQTLERSSQLDEPAEPAARRPISPVPLIVVDPGLRDDTGHHAGFLSLLASRARQAANRPGDITVYSHRQISGSVKRKASAQHIRVRPHFHSRFYESYGRKPDLPHWHAYMVRLAVEYLEVLREIAGKRRGGLVLHHTLDWTHLTALGLAMRFGEFPPGDARHLVLLLFNPGIGHDGEVFDVRLSVNYQLALTLFESMPNVSLYATCREYLLAYRKLVSNRLRIGFAPCLLVDAPTAAQGRPSLASFRDVPLDRTTWTLFLGDAKTEKGFARLPDHIDALLPRIGPGSLLRVHYGLSAELESAEIDLAIERLNQRSATDRRVIVNQGFLDHNQMSALISNTDVFLFDYDRDVYAEKASGLLWLICFQQKPVILIGESWLSREAARLNPWVVCLPSLAALTELITRTGRLRFERGRVDERYCAELFHPFDDFLAGIPQRDEP